MSKKSKGKKNKDFDSDLEDDQSIDIKGKSKGSRNDPEISEKVPTKSAKKKKGKKVVR